MSTIQEKQAVVVVIKIQNAVNQGGMYEYGILNKYKYINNILKLNINIAHCSLKSRDILYYYYCDKALGLNKI